MAEGLLKIKLLTLASVEIEQYRAVIEWLFNDRYIIDYDVVSKEDVLINFTSSSDQKFHQSLISKEPIIRYKDRENILEIGITKYFINLYILKKDKLSEILDDINSILEKVNILDDKYISAPKITKIYIKSSSEEMFKDKLQIFEKYSQEFFMDIIDPIDNEIEDITYNKNRVFKWKDSFIILDTKIINGFVIENDKKEIKYQLMINTDALKIYENDLEINKFKDDVMELFNKMRKIEKNYVNSK